MSTPLTIVPAKRRVRRKRRTQATAPPPPINTIDRVTVQSDGKTLDLYFTAGTVLTGVGDVNNGFFVNYSGGQTSAPTASVLGPAHIRMILSDAIDDPSTWEVEDPDLFSFATGVFAGPFSGDVVFV
jgi:hypothetical protein